MRKPIMKPANACDVVYIVVMLALSRKRVHLRKIFREPRLLHKDKAVAYGLILRQNAVEFISL